MDSLPALFCNKLCSVDDPLLKRAWISDATVVAVMRQVLFQEMSQALIGSNVSHRDSLNSYTCAARLLRHLKEETEPDDPIVILAVSTAIEWFQGQKLNLHGRNFLELLKTIKYIWEKLHPPQRAAFSTLLSQRPPSAPLDQTSHREIVSCIRSLIDEILFILKTVPENSLFKSKTKDVLKVLEDMKALQEALEQEKRELQPFSAKKWYVHWMATRERFAKLFTAFDPEQVTIACHKMPLIIKNKTLGSTFKEQSQLDEIQSQLFHAFGTLQRKVEKETRTVSQPHLKAIQAILEDLRSLRQAWQIHETTKTLDMFVDMWLAKLDFSDYLQQLSAASASSWPSLRETFEKTIIEKGEVILEMLAMVLILNEINTGLEFKEHCPIDIKIWKDDPNKKYIFDMLSPGDVTPKIASVDVPKVLRRCRTAFVPILGMLTKLKELIGGVLIEKLPPPPAALPDVTPSAAQEVFESTALLATPLTPTPEPDSEPIPSLTATAAAAMDTPPLASSSSASRSSVSLHNIKTRTMRSLLEQYGWVLARSRGSHQQYRHPQESGVVTLPSHGGGRTLSIGVAKQILERIGIKDLLEDTDD